MAHTAKAPQFFDVPAGTPPKACAGCHASVFWITTQRGARMPVDVGVDGGRTPTADAPGRGVSHFINCVEAGRFRRDPRGRR